MNEILSYRDLFAWKKSIVLAKHIYQLGRYLPKEELYGLASQLKRAAVSVPSNIAEGHARNHRKEFVQFLGIARGSLSEVQTLLVLAVKLELLDRKLVEGPFRESIEVEKIPNRLRNSLTP